MTTAITYYVIAELDAKGQPVKYVPSIGVGQNSGHLYWLTDDLDLARKFADKAAADQHADVLNATNPGNNLRAIELPTAG
jgi:hypothetical protein